MPMAESVRRMRVAVGGFYHETNTRARARTRLADFKAYQYAEGTGLAPTFAGTNSEIGGMLDWLEENDHEPVPLLFAAAVPSGPIEHDCYVQLRERFLALLADAGPVDAVLISLHGAAVVDGLDDADGGFVAAVRAAVGAKTPIGVTLDYHANISAALFEAASFVSVYRTYPHTDMAERGREAARITLAPDGPPAGVMRKLPLVTVPLVQATGDPSMAGTMQAFGEALAAPGISSVSLAMGFAYADSPDLGATVLAYAREREQAASVADRLATAVWAQRGALLPKLVTLEALPAALASDQTGTTVVVDPSDNVGGGSAGDGTAVLETLLAAGLGGVVVITDPDAVAEAETAGPGGAFDAAVGAKADTLHGRPVRFKGLVQWLGDASFTNTSSYMTGFVTRMGRCAVVSNGKLHAVLTGRRTMPFDTGILTAVGLDPQAQPVIVVKSAIAWRAAFGPLARRVLVADTPGICPARLRAEHYSKARRPIWPLDPDVDLDTDIDIEQKARQP
ncbi:M81 family metallopeptidase [Roseitalea porphyridii]|uniref:Microcystinase C n=1 Tax=Roseitalea porphyridii TaxID=1852022 RepID=A0A4P6V248_9HYPH|nr:M81 family metallopeptidase [Roseitalea porphyridii]QBK30739.1 M81 family peptidase [Roseitalea porphyridii]